MISLENHTKIILVLAIISLSGLAAVTYGLSSSPDSWWLLIEDALYFFLAFVAYPLLWALCIYGITRGFVPFLKGKSSMTSNVLTFFSLMIFVGVNVTLPYIYTI